MMGRLTHNEFQLHKIRQAIKVNGEMFTFYKTVQNEFKESVLSEDFVAIEGIFHEAYSQVTINNADDARVKRVPSPSVLLVTREDYMPDTDSVMIYKDKKYRVIGFKDVSNMGVATEISLEEIT